MDQRRLYRDIDLTDTTLTLVAQLVRHYARAGELAPWQNLVAAQGEIYVQFWLKPGDPAVAFTPGEERPVDLIPEKLKPYL